MSFGVDYLGAAAAVNVDVYTRDFRISGTVQTRFTRVAEILNQMTHAYLSVDHATISEHADPTATRGAPQAWVAADQILLMVAPGLGGEARADMRIPKRPVMAQLSLPPLRVTGRIHVPMGGRPIDGLLNVTDRFVAMTDVTIESGVHPELGRSVGAIAIRRDRAHILLVADDENSEQLLADVLDQRTAESWLHREEEGEG
jgi:hypothetical protein